MRVPWLPAFASSARRVLPVHVLHREVVNAAVLADLEHLRDVLVVERRREPRFVQEHLHRGVIVRALRRDQLQNDVPLEAADAGAAADVNPRHATGRERHQQLVLAEARRAAPLPWLRLARRRSFHSEGSSQANAARRPGMRSADATCDVPASVMCDTRNVGAAVELRISRSLATRSIRLRISSKFAAIVTSLDREGQLAAFDPEALRAAREIAGDRVEAEAHERR